MSLIHEALKKAERQRHLGEAPTLDSPSFVHRQRRGWLLPLIVLAIIVAGGYWVVRAWRGGSAPSTAVARVDAAPAKAMPATEKAVAQTKPVAMTPNAGSQPIAGNAPAAARAHTPPAAKTPVAKPNPKSMLPKPGATSAQKWVATTPPPKAALAAQPLPNPTSKPVAKPATRAAAKPTLPVAITPVAPAADKSAASTAPAAASTSLPMYWQLPYAERKDLPDLNISMHVYAAKPADRFVILNGARQVQGDDLGNGMKLVAIRRDGIVIDRNGKRFVVPNAAVH